VLDLLAVRDVRQPAGPLLHIPVVIEDGHGVTGHMPILAIRAADAVFSALVAINRTHFLNDDFKRGTIFRMHGIEPALSARLLERLAGEFIPVGL